MLDLTLPGKTYLAGEYEVLMNGKALVILTPRVFRIEYPQSSVGVGLNQLSPAGELLVKHGHWDECSAKIKVSAAQHCEKGFGRSAAEFWAAWLVLQMTSAKPRSEDHPFSHDSIWQCFEQYKALPSSGFLSGGDIVAMGCRGRLLQMDLKNQKLLSLDVHFPNLKLWIIVTGLKLPTHESVHNEAPKIKLPTKGFTEPIADSIRAGDEQQFINELKYFRDFLRSHAYEHPNSTQLIDLIEKIPGIQLVKGCGAMGADTLLAVGDIEMSTAIENHFEQLNFHFWSV